MKMRFLGNTGLQVSTICLGTASFGGRGEYEATGTIGQEEANRIVNRCFEEGINIFNTAEDYSKGWAEEILGKALGPKRKDAVLVTKISPFRNTKPNEGGFSRKWIIDGCEASLRRLGTDYIDVYELHFFDDYTPLEVVVRSLDDLVRSGKVRYTGCSNFEGWRVMKGLMISDKYGWERFSTVEAMYNIASRWVEFELGPLCVDQGIGILAFSPLHGGYLSGKYRRNQPWPQGTRFDRPDTGGGWPVDYNELYKIVDELGMVAKAHNVNIAQTAINYLLRKPAVSSLIIGMRNERQLEETIKATDWEMTAEEFQRLDEVSNPIRRHPYQKVTLE